MKVIERIITIEYFDQRMSRQIAGKFPDATAYDFDYQQSGIWSPLLPRGTFPVSSSGDHLESLRKRRRCSIGRSPLFAKPMKSVKRKKKKKGKALCFNLANGATPKKAWYRLFGAASKCLKKTQGGPSLQLGMPTVDC
ncbi:uncharacterized protein LOC116254915 [Nymphaea colorata]|nr:uncharacterized protein LOC116254915 [Nymphaea colorata]